MPPDEWTAHTRAQWDERTRLLAKAGFTLEAMARDRWAADHPDGFAHDGLDEDNSRPSS